jgi:hypothetical protein
MILVNGDSFTAGEESSLAWPSLILNTVNIARSGASNDYICRTTVGYIENQANKVDAVIIAWTSPNRIEIGNQHLTPSSHRRYGEIVDWIFDNKWNDRWADSKFLTQVRMMEGYLRMRKIPFLFISTFDIQTRVDSSISMPEEYLGWPSEGIVEWMGDCPKGPGGHPLEQGHIKIALKINEHIRNLGWVS